MARSHLGQVPGHPSESPRPDGDDAVSPSLPLPDQDEPPSPIEIREREPEEFRAAHAGRVERLQDGAVAEPHRLAQVGLEEHLFDFRDTAHRRQPVLHPRELQSHRRIGSEVLLPR